MIFISEIKQELKKYINYFKNKKKYQINDLDEINKILNSKEYFELINKIYDHQNSKCHSNPHSVEDRLCFHCYDETDRVINYFWEQLLGTELNREFMSNLKLKLKL